MSGVEKAGIERERWFSDLILISTKSLTRYIVTDRTSVDMTLVTGIDMMGVNMIGSNSSPVGVRCYSKS